MDAPAKSRPILPALTALAVLLAASAVDVGYRAQFADRAVRRIEDRRGERIAEVDALAQVLAVGAPIEDDQDVPVLHNALRGSGRMRYQVVFLRIMTGLHRGRIVAAQNVLQFNPAENIPLRRGSLAHVSLDAQGGRVHACEFIKPAVRVVDSAWMIAALLIAGIIALGARGVAFTAAFVLTGVAFAVVWAPVASGRLPMEAALVVYVTAVSVICLCLTGAVGRKALSAVAGATAGILTGSGVVWLLQRMLDLSGLENVYAVFLREALGENGASFNFPGLLVCGAVIAILGLTLDLGVSVAAGMDHVRREDPAAGRKKLLDVGLGLSRDITGTMILTLVFVWLGVRVHVLLLPWALGITPRELINCESLSAEVLRISAGTMGLIVTGPVTALVCAALPIRAEKGNAAGPRVFARARLWGLSVAMAVVAAGLAWFVFQNAELAGGPPLVWKWRNLPRPERLPAKEALERSEAEMRAGSLDEAAWILWGVRAREADNGRVRRNLARIYAARRWFVPAESEIRPAIEKLPDDSQTHYIAGVVDAWRNRPESARAHLQKALELDPSNDAAATAFGHLFGPVK